MARVKNAVPAERGRWRGLTAALWVLAAILGTMAVAAAASIIHESGQRRAAARVFARGVAAQVEATARERLELLAYEKMAPLAAEAPRADPVAVLAALAAREQYVRACACGDSIPALQFFESDGTKVRVANVDALPTGIPLIDTSVVSRIAADERRRGDAASVGRVHVVANRELGERAVVTFADRLDRGAARPVYGFVASARLLAAMLIAPPGSGGGFVLANVDSTSIGLETADSVLLAGRVRAAPAVTTTGRAAGPLDLLRVNVALSTPQLPRSLLGPPPQELWHLGALLFATAIVVTIAARWSRRELMLARARSDFIAGVSHDLRMPLAQILLAGETLVADPTRSRDERAGLTTSILRETRRLIAMVENILLFSQGKVDERPRRDVVSVAQLFEDAVEAVALAAEDAGQRVETVAFAGAAVMGGRRALCQSLVNLIDNSLKYGPRGQRITLRAVDRGDGHTWLSVEDEGPGIPAAERAKVFDPYHRLARDAQSERTGTGLGLAVVQRIVDGCDGRVWVDDAPAGGARIVIELRTASLAASEPLVTVAT